ncbi:MAG: AraC family transcriptional regulator [Eisenbergiella sp.]
MGYENVSSFRRKFKKELGITPSQYRNGVEEQKGAGGQRSPG